MKKIIPIFLIIIFSLTSCHHDTQKKNEKIITVQINHAPKKLFYSGMLLPIQNYPVVSPVDGNITILGFSYGDFVQKDQVLLTINSNTLSETYRKDVSDYLEKKQNYLTQENQFKGSDALYKAGVISRNEYLNDKTTYENAIINYFQSKYQLKKTLDKVGMDYNQIKNLSLNDTDTVNKILQKHFSHIVIRAPKSGIVLFPPKTDSNQNNSADIAGTLVVGSAIKQDELLLTIGNMSGMRATFNVSEMDIDRIARGMKVLVTSPALPGITMQGVIASVSAQANQNENQNAISEFSIGVEIPTLDAKTAKEIRVGMTATFSVLLPETGKIKIPIAAVSVHDQKNWVRVVDNHGHEKNVAVITGETGVRSVEITQGLMPGEKIVVPVT